VRRYIIQTIELKFLGGNRSDIQLPDIDIIGESGEVEPRGTSSGNHH
jgi:hypothetical protein